MFSTSFSNQYHGNPLEDIKTKDPSKLRYEVMFDSLYSKIMNPSDFMYRV